MAPRAPEIAGVHVGTRETRIAAGSEAEARARMAGAPALLLRNLLDPDLLALVQARCGPDRFVRRQTRPVLEGQRWVEEEPRMLGRMMNAALTRGILLRWIEAVTRCGPLTNVAGEVAEMRAAPEDFLSWHVDTFDEPRRIAITVDLSDKPYEGGAFEMRERAGGRMVLRHQYQADGSALIYPLSDDIEHRVLPVLAGGPRRVFAGWFRAAH